MAKERAKPTEDEGQVKKAREKKVLSDKVTKSDEKKHREKKGQKSKKPKKHKNLSEEEDEDVKGMVAGLRPTMRGSCG